MTQPDLNNVFFLFCFAFWWEGGRGGGGWEGGVLICSYHCFQELYLETRHGEVHFSQHFLFKIERYVQSRQNCWDT